MLFFFTAFAVFLISAPTQGAVLGRGKNTVATYSNLLADLEACVPLSNKGVYSTAEIQIGTPVKGEDGQKFSVVADTGSNDLVIPSCVCVQSGKCANFGHCFMGTNKSSTFNLSRQLNDPNEPIMVLIRYGSGPIQCALATEVVKMGELETILSNGVLLITNSGLETTPSVSFEGILGLGPPQSSLKIPGLVSAVLSEQPQINYESGRIGHSASRLDHNDWVDRQPMMAQFPTFTGAAGLKRFEMCFNEGQDGAIRFGGKAFDNSMRAIGSYHWALNLTGFSIGNESSPKLLTDICGSTAIDGGSNTPCAMIPDSGTTSIMLPASYIQSIIEELCQRWPRCNKEYVAARAAAKAASAAYKTIKGEDPFNLTLKLQPKLSEMFEMLVDDCQAWMTPAQGLKEMPSLFFQLSDVTGNVQKIEISPWAYVMQFEGLANAVRGKNDRDKFDVRIDEDRSVDDSVEAIHQAIYSPPKHLLRTEQRDGQASFEENEERAIVEAQVLIEALRATELRERYRRNFNVTRARCVAALSPMQYKTKQNGPVWIIGTPLFYDYIVGFDLTDPPAVSFVSQKGRSCDQCGASSSLAAEANTFRNDEVRLAPRRFVPPFRLPSVDTSSQL